MMWDLARALREYVTKNPPTAEYVLATDYRYDPDNWARGYVHFVVCDRQGNWAIVDMQNSHHEHYATVSPTSDEGCQQVLIKRLTYYLSGENKT